MSVVVGRDSSAAIRGGACAAWPLPRTPECARQARRLVYEVAGGLGLAGSVVDDLLVVASELATNALVHGGDHVLYREGRPVAGLPELWLYLRGLAPRELVLTVYNAGTGWSGSSYADLAPAGLREDGRGLPIVAALAGQASDRWGHHPTRSRLGERRLPGTAAWFTLPLPHSLNVGPTPLELTADMAVDRLAALLTSRGIDGLITRANGTQALLSCPTGLTVWVRDGTYWWDGSNGLQRHRVTDLTDVAERVLAETERVTRERKEEDGCLS